MSSKDSVRVSSVTLGGLLPFSATMAEVKKVHRPTKQETIQASIEVFVMIGVMVLYLGLADFCLGSFMRLLLR